MTTDFNLCFIRQKLSSIKNASMLISGNQALRLPNDIVQLINVDDNGQLWFIGHKPRGWINNYDQSFPAKLFFYQKGVEFYLEAKGTAFIANHEDILRFENEIGIDTILLKMTPSVIEYTEPGTRSSFEAIYKLYSSLRNWFGKKVPVYNMGNKNKQVA